MNSPFIPHANADIIWINTSGDNFWNTASKWSSNTIPVDYDSVTIGNSGTDDIIDLAGPTTNNTNPRRGSVAPAS